MKFLTFVVTGMTASSLSAAEKRLTALKDVTFFPLEAVPEETGYTVGEARSPLYPRTAVNRLLAAECAKRGLVLTDWHLHLRGGMTARTCGTERTDLGMHVHHRQGVGGGAPEDGTVLRCAVAEAGVAVGFGRRAPAPVLTRSTRSRVHARREPDRQGRFKNLQVALVETTDEIIAALEEQKDGK